MKALLFIAFMALCTTCNAQFLIGKTRQQVRDFAISHDFYETSTTDSILEFEKKNSVTPISFGFRNGNFCDFQMMMIDGSKFKFWYNLLSENFGEAKATYIENKISEYSFRKNKFTEYTLTAPESESSIMILMGFYGRNN